MATAGKRAFKIQEFVAHGGNVNCAAMGHDSSRVLASGGEDRKVNLWAIGKSNYIMSLSGHTSPVEAVRFKPDEKAVVAGSLSGAVKIWDLEAIKILRTLTGHKSAIRCLDYHPFNDFLITGSADTNIKVWDMRRKSCLFTYSGHSNCVNCIRFSPDAQWMASGGEDGVIKLWDMSAGKQLAAFRQHTGPVNTIQFHPNDLLLASGSSDRTVKFWDLEVMQMVGTTDGDSTPVRSLLFHPKENCLYSGGVDFLKVYGWEPSRCLDSVAVGWGRPADMTIVDNQLVGVSFSQSSLSTFVVEIQKVPPLGGPPYQQATSIPPQSTTSVHRRRSFLSDHPHTQYSAMKISDDEPTQGLLADDESEDNASGVEISDMLEYKEVFQPRRELPRGSLSDLASFSSANDEKKSTPSNVNKKHHSRHGASPARLEESPSDFQPVMTGASRQQPPPPAPPSHSYLPPEARMKRPPTSCSKSSRNNGDVIKENARLKNRRVNADENSETKQRLQQPSADDRVSLAKDRSLSRHSTEDQGEMRQKQPMQQDNLDILPDRFDRLRVTDESVMNASRSGVAPHRRPSPVASENKLISNRLVDDFLPKQKTPPGDIDVSTAVDSILGGHDALMAVLSARHRNLLVIKTMWTTGNIKMAVDAAVAMNDPAVLHDVVNMMLQKASSWSLDHCTCLLPILGNLVSSKYDNYVETGLSGIKLILRNFGPIIKANITAPPSVGVDISREERSNKCLFCHKELMKIRSELDRRASQCSGQRALNYKEIQLLMNQLD